MKLHDVFGRWLRRRRPSNRPASRQPRLRLRLEQLEDRTVPSNFTAASVSDLIADINAANLAGGSNTITLVAGKTFTLTGADNSTDGANGLPVIAANDNLTILGNGDIIERSTATGTGAFRLFDVAAGASLTLENLTLQGGLALGEEGGAAYNQGTFILDGATVQNNTASRGGGLYSNGVLTITNSSIANNLAIGGRGADGYLGPCWNPMPSSCSGHPVPGTDGGSAFGGGVYVGGGTVTISSAILTGNTAQGGNGGNGLNQNGHTSSAGNGGGGFGGGLYAASGAVSLHDTTVTANLAQGGAGGTGASGKLDGKRGQGVGGGLYIGTLASVGPDDFTIHHVKHNDASTSDNDIAGLYDVIN